MVSWASDTCPSKNGHTYSKRGTIHCPKTRNLAIQRGIQSRNLRIQRYTNWKVCATKTDIHTPKEAQTGNFVLQRGTYSKRRANFPVRSKNTLQKSKPAHTKIHKLESLCYKEEHIRNFVIQRRYTNWKLWDTKRHIFKT